jgi:hypothetical protein
MKQQLLLLFTSLASAYNPLYARTDNCSTSFYCYGNSAHTLAVTPRPAPLPPPNVRSLPQRNSAIMSLRPRAATPRSITPRRMIPPQPIATPRVAPPRPPATADVNVRVIPAAPASPPPINACAAQRQHLFNLAKQRESQAVIASQRGDRQASIRLFREANQLRQQAASCR